MKILLTFIGNNDCYINDGRKGAIVSILEKEEFNKVYILYTKEIYLKPASDILKYCQKYLPEIEINYFPAIVENPTDYNTVYPTMYKALNDIKAGNIDSNFTISVTSGTPTIHSCWIFLKEGGVINAKLIQVSRDSKIEEIKLTLDDFPQIKKIDSIKAELTKVSRENKKLKEELELIDDKIIGNSDLILKLKKRVKKIATTNLSVLITGSSGTGKELFAEAIHKNSKRKKHQFIQINCGAISQNLFESEFFGHKSGAFTGAVKDKRGKFLDADKGTIFLDEIGDLPLEMQVKLLRVLENGTFTPVGDNKEIKVDVRVISATNKDLDELIEEKKFREDLFYRIAKDHIKLPDLHKRGNDVLLISEYFIGKLNKEQKAKKYLSKDSKKIIENYYWPGNIRELKNVIERAYAYSDNSIEKEEFDIIKKKRTSLDIFIPDTGLDLDNEIIPQYYIEALKKTGGVKKEAAKLLKINDKTFIKRLKSKGIR